ncbi:hypothetical protein Nepgr_014225 [Nepenthes gracilis]|uniref:Uncharacterized protein n=1 Tax=Nepenthes gracilis TaxID=150966 RepID=A0AAD3SKJ2_NEPGR|nr:hypothetical protein Nepgr_014225 [Nepenthes gracilis]
MRATATHTENISIYQICRDFEEVKTENILRTPNRGPPNGSRDKFLQMEQTREPILPRKSIAKLQKNFAQGNRSQATSSKACDLLTLEDAASSYDRVLAVDLSTSSARLSNADLSTSSVDSQLDHLRPYIGGLVLLPLLRLSLRKLCLRTSLSLLIVGDHPAS